MTGEAKLQIWLTITRQTSFTSVILECHRKQSLGTSLGAVFVLHAEELLVLCNKQTGDLLFPKQQKRKPAVTVELRESQVSVGITFGQEAVVAHTFLRGSPASLDHETSLPCTSHHKAQAVSSCLLFIFSLFSLHTFLFLNCCVQCQQYFTPCHLVTAKYCSIVL